MTAITAEKTAAMTMTAITAEKTAASSKRCLRQLRQVKMKGCARNTVEY